MPNTPWTTIRTDMGSTIVDPYTGRMQWFGFLASVVVFVVVLTKGMGFHADNLYLMLRPTSDGWGYFHYLPALLGTHDWEHLPWTHQLDHGDHLSMFSYGVALLELPWFMVGHVLAWASGNTMDGYSAPYAASILFGMAVYAGASVNLLFHALRRRFPVHVALATPILVLAGTNLYFYSTKEPVMSHAYIYFLFAALHYLVVRNVEEPKALRTLGIIVICSVALLIRQLHVVAILFPAFYLTSNWHDVRERLRWFGQNWSITLLAVVLAVLVWVPQMSYWKLITGKYFIFPYGYKDEHFIYALDPHLADVLVGVVNGWWVYTPLMALACGALVWMAIRRVTGALPIVLMVILVWYAYSAWWCWWLGGAFGHRGFVEYYAFLSIPLAWLLERLSRATWPWRLSSALLFTLLMYVNLGMTEITSWDWNQPEWSWSRLGQVYIEIFK